MTDKCKKCRGTGVETVIVLARKSSPGQLGGSSESHWDYKCSKCGGHGFDAMARIATLERALAKAQFAKPAHPEPPALKLNEGAEVGLLHEGNLTNDSYSSVYGYLAEVCERDIGWVTKSGLRGDATVAGRTLAELVKMCNVHLKCTQSFVWRPISSRVRGGTPTPPIEALAPLRRILPVLLERRDHYVELKSLEEDAAESATASRAAAFRAASRTLADIKLSKACH